MSQLDTLRLSEVGERRYAVHQPAEPPEGRDVVFSGQLLGQMMTASAEASGGAKDIRSVHAVFARAGTYSQPLEVEVDHMHAGRTWASDTVTAVQGGKLLSRAVVLMNTVDGDLIRHGPRMPDVTEPEALEPGPGLAFPGAELRAVPGEATVEGVPVQRTWHRYAPGVATPTANQAVLVWATCGSLIGLAFRPHGDVVDIADAHRTISTGVIAHTAHFLERFDVSQWLLVEEEATKAAVGRVYGRGRVFTRDGSLVATYEQDSMARAAAASLDASRSL
ncbi:MAG TPA: acyl-CoA thioesterase domain-containing protein [Acidimicrobiales bacterium]|nr:acyl-CoA thioesterase domain-containing protein [Acidimicrobiales bacterium]